MTCHDAAVTSCRVNSLYPGLTRALPDGSTWLRVYKIKQVTMTNDKFLRECARTARLLNIEVSQIDTTYLLERNLFGPVSMIAVVAIFAACHTRCSGMGLDGARGSFSCTGKAPEEQDGKARTVELEVTHEPACQQEAKFGICKVQKLQCCVVHSDIGRAGQWRLQT
jgi:hypothetical protein